MMKTTKKYLSFLLFLLVLVWKSSSLAQAQSDTIYTGSITVTTQAAVDALRDTLAGKTTINGDVDIGPSSDITDLTPFTNITNITGNLEIQRNGQLINLNDLTHLQTIGGSFKVFRGDLLTTLGDFPALDSIGGRFQVSNTENLITLGNFPVLQTIGERFRVTSNNRLTDLGSFPDLQTIGKYFQVTSNDQLTDLGNFPDLQTIGEYFSVSTNNRLPTLGNFPDLQTIGGYFRVFNNDRLTTLGDFPELTSIGTGNNLLIRSLDERKDNVSILVEENPNLSNCHVLTEFLSDGATSVSGDIYIDDNTIGCKSISDITISYYDDIIVTTQAEVNTLQTTLSGKTIIVGNLIIGDTTTGNSRSDIDSLTPLSNIAHIIGNLIIQQNGSLVNLTGLDSLQSIGGGFNVINNDSLTTLENFSALMSIGTHDNGNSIVVENNPRLSDCYVLTEFLSGGDTAVGGTIFISGNAISCNSQNDIKTRYNGDVTVTTQAAVDSLNTTTLSGKTIIDGNLTIGSSSDISDITNLSPLSSIVRITGNITIQQNGSLVNLTGLDNLQSIGGGFRVSNNDSLTTLDFPALMSIGTHDNRDSIVVKDNPRLSDCYALTEFLSGGDTAISVGIDINNNAPACNSQNDIKTRYNGNITVTTQAEVNALRDTLAGKTRIDGNLTIGDTTGSSQSDITDLTPLSNIIEVTGNIIIQQNGSLVNLTGLDSLQSIGGYFSVINNDSLTTLENFSALMSIGNGKVFVPSLSDSINDASIVVENNDRLSGCQVLTKFISDESTANIYITNNAPTCNSSSSIQSIYNGDITVTTQAEVNTLQTTLSGKTIIDGNLTIGDTTESSLSNIIDLTLLSNITDITGNLIIQQNGSLGNLTGLDSLQSIGGYFSVYNNNRLPTLGNFPALMSIGVGNDVSIPSLSENRDNVSIVIENNPILSDCYALTEFLSGGTTAVSGVIDINNNAPACNSQNDIKIRYKEDIIVKTQADVDALNTSLAGKTIIVGKLTIGYTGSTSLRSNITDLTPLRNMSHITGNLRIGKNKQLVNLTGLNSLKTIGGYFSVDDNDSLTTLGNFPALDTIGGYFSVYNNNRLPTLGNFPALDAIGEGFRVRGNNNLTTLGNFPALDTIGIRVPSRDHTSIRVVNNPKLSDCYVLTEFLSGGTTAVSGEISIFNNLSNCNSTTNLRNTIHKDDITVTTQAEVNTLQTTLSGNTIIDGNLTIGSSSDITDLSPLRSIVRITGNITIQQNGSLVNLTGLGNLQTIGGGFRVNNNDGLTSLDFPELISIGNGKLLNDTSIVVENNNTLSGCHVLTEFLSGGATSVSGGIYINDNAIGCDNQNDIKASYYDDILVTTRAEVNTLQTTLSGKTIIVGNLTVGYTDGSNTQSDITDLSPLSNIAHIIGNLIIQQNGSLVNLTGLDNLQSIGGGFSVINNDSLTTLENFSALMSIGTNDNGNSIVVKDNPRLSDCYVLTEFLSGGDTAVSVGIDINNNAPACNSQNDIKTRYNGNITVTTQAEVNALRDTLAGKTRIDGNLTIGDTTGSSQSDITDLTPLSNIIEVTGNIIIQQNGSLVNLTGLDSLQSIGGYFSVINNGSLTTLENFPVLQTIKGAFLAKNHDNLSTLGSFPVLQSIGGYFSVNNNNSLTTLGNFPALTSIGTGITSSSRNNVSIVIENNLILSDCYALTEFLPGGTHAVSGSVTIQNNASVCTNQSTLDNTIYRDSIIVETQTEVDALITTLSGKTIIDGNLTIGYTDGRLSNIDSLTPLNNITHITGNLIIQQNGSLIDLSGFNSLRTIGGYFSVNNNDSLTFLGDFSALTSIGTNNDGKSIVVEGNSLLAYCCALKEFRSGGIHQVSGSVDISNNAMGCDSEVNCAPFVHLSEGNALMLSDDSSNVGLHTF